MSELADPGTCDDTQDEPRMKGPRVTNCDQGLAGPGSTGCGRRDARIANAGDGRVDVLVHHHVDEHDDEDERVRPCAVRDELLHDGAPAPALPHGLEELVYREREEDGLENERNDPVLDEPRPSGCVLL